MENASHVHDPVLRVTPYDQVSSWLIALVSALVLAVCTLVVVWSSIEPAPTRNPIPVEIVEVVGGVEDGAIDESLRLESPDPESEQASNADVEADVSEIQETLENVMDVATEATDQAERQFEFQTRSAGPKGSAKGTGRRALGVGAGKGGVSREQRWVVSYNDRETLTEYGRQLDFFGIELGMLTPDGKLVYLSKLAQGKPASRIATSGSDEQRLFMTWQGGARRKADVQLFEKAGIQAGKNPLLQFYPADVEQKLAELELKFRNRPLKEIRRTSFSTRPRDSGQGYEFYVTQQTYFQSLAP